MTTRLRFRALVVLGLGTLLVVAGACSSDDAKGRAAPKAGRVVKVFDPGKDGAVNGIALRGDGTLFVSTSRDVRAIPREGRHEIILDKAVGALVAGKDAIYGLGIRDGVVWEFAPGRRSAGEVALANAPDTAGPTDPGLDEPHSIAWDPKSETILVADRYKVDRINPRSRMTETVTGARGKDGTNQSNGVAARDARYAGINDIAVDPTDGALYLSSGGLYRIDPSTGLLTFVPAKAGGIGTAGFAFDARTGDLFLGTEDLLGDGRLWRLARDGSVAIIVKAFDESIRGLALDPKDGALYIATEEAVFVCATPEPEKCEPPD